MTRPTVSVLIPTYNRARFIAESLESVFGQTIPPSQVIVINDGSTDNTRAALEPFRQRIEYIQSENRGKPSALNLAMDRAAGEYVWIMDDDDVALPDALERHLAILGSYPEFGWTYSSYIDSTTSRENGRIVPLSEKPLPVFPEEEFLVRLMEQCFLIHPTVLVRTECYRQVGAFRNDLIRCQDYEMAVRLARRFPCARVAGPTIYHRSHGGSRGSARDTFDVDRIQEKWLEYMQIFFRQLRMEMPLGEYLIECQTLNGEGSNLRSAYLRRMGIMARKRMYPEMFEDLQLAQKESSESPFLSNAERQLLHETFRSISDPLFFRQESLRRLRSVCDSPVGFAIRYELIRLLYWDAIVATRKRRLFEVIGSAAAAMRLAGTGVLRSLINEKKSHRRSAGSCPLK